MSRPERYEISGVVSPFVVVPQLTPSRAEAEEGGRGEEGGWEGDLMYARRELPPSDNCPMWARSLLVATSIGHVSMFKATFTGRETKAGNPPLIRDGPPQTSCRTPPSAGILKIREALDERL